MAKNICKRCGHGYGSKVHKTHCQGKSVTQVRAERRVAARRSAGSRVSHRRYSSYSFAPTWDSGIVVNMDYYRKDKPVQAQAQVQ